MQYQAGDKDQPRMDASFRASKVEFILMFRKLSTSDPAELEWDVPDRELFEDVMMGELAKLVETDSNKAAVLQWSSVGLSTGVGQFALSTDQYDAMDEYRQLLRTTEHEDYEFESFPKDSLLKTYGISFYAHRGARHFTPETLLKMFRDSHLSLIHI